MSNKRPLVLVVEDDEQIPLLFQTALPKEGYAVEVAQTGEEALKMVKKELPALVVTDVRLPGINGLETFRRLREIEPHLPVIVMTGHGNTDIAIEATRLGAFDYVLKPFTMDKMLLLIRQAVDSGSWTLSPVEMDASPEAVDPYVIIGNSKVMQEVYKAIGRSAPTDATILLRGESGTGKELVARAIYQYSNRKEKPLKVINCVAIPESLLESELFGYEKGAFTGASSRRIGKIEQANGGTVFLDEIGDMPFTIQSKILRLLQEKTLERLGGHENIHVDVRIIAATNCDLEAYIAQDRFRKDLYYRLKVVSITLPPLRNRTEDIPLLAEYFLARFSKEMGVAKPGLSDEARALLESYYWPGNVRELANLLKKALIFGQGYLIQSEHIIDDLASAPEGQISKRETQKKIIREWVRDNLVLGEHSDIMSYFIDFITKIVIEEVFDLTQSNLSRAAQILGISRHTLRDKIIKLKIKGGEVEEGHS